MVFGIKNNFIIKSLVFIFSMIVMVGAYILASRIYVIFFTISSHKSVGMIFVSFFFYFIASPVLLLSFFVNKKTSATLFFAVFIYLFYEWFSVHPLRVLLMAICFLIGFIFTVVINEIIHKTSKEQDFNNN